MLAITAGATGHSQGVVAAVAAARASTAADLVSAAVDAVVLLFWQGLRMQEAYDCLPAAARIPPPGKDAPKVDEEPSCMLAINGITAAQVQEQIAVTAKLIAKVELGAAAVKAMAAGEEPPSSLPAGPAPLGISLINGSTNIVVSGRPAHLQALYNAVHAIRAAPGADQARVPHSQRKPVVRLQYLKVSAPFHSGLLGAAVEKAVADCTRSGISMPRSSLKVPVYSTADGADLRSGDDGSLVAQLIQLQTVQAVDWPAALSGVHNPPAGGSKATHVLDFGPGGASSAARLTARHIQGAGVAVVLASLAASTGSVDAEAEAASSSLAAASNAVTNTESLPLFDVRMAITTSAADLEEASSKFAPDWAAVHGPRVVKRASDGALLLDTAYSRLLGRPPVMIAGMTPCTSYYGIPLVAACTNAGYHTELACGGLPRPNIFRDRIAKLQSMLQPGHGIGLNMLYLNARQWGFQYPMVGQLIREGVPIETVCVAAGIPSLDTGIEIVKNLEKAGVKFVSFKPGSVEAIKRTCDIAAAVAPFPIVVQWTGGRAGGHHSFEDVHAPMLATYALIRRHSNIVLLAGSGFGSAECALPYITGEWAVTNGASVSKMPFDGVLMASRVMVAKEASTSFEVKQVLVDCPGVENEAEWETAYNGIAGGILTVKSELGEPIHKVANRGMLFWREMDTRFFALPRDKRPAAIAAAKDYIIGKLNADYQKVYFGRAADGSVVDPEQMTYSEVAARMVELMFVQPHKERLDLEPAHEDYTPHGRWVDVTFRDRVFLFLQRTEATMRGSAGAGADKTPRLMTSPAQLNPGAKSAAAGKDGKTASSSATFAFDNPADLVTAFFQQYYLAGTNAVLSASDFDQWLEDCKSRGKPVPFVPVIDGELEVWFKKDSLWYSEDLAAVPDRDAGRVAILQGPVAVRHSKVVNEPAADILNGVHDGICKALVASAGGAAATVEALGGVLDLVPSTAAAGLVAVAVDGSKLTFTSSSPASGASDEAAIAAVCSRLRYGPEAAALQREVTWALALLSSKFIVHESPSPSSPGGVAWKYAPNPAQRVFKLTAGRSLILTVGAASSLQLIETSSASPLVTASLSGSTVSLIFHDVRPATPDAPAEACPLTMTLSYRPTSSYAPLALSVPAWGDEVKRYYSSLWFSESDQASIAALDVGTPLTSSYTVTAADVDAFTSSTVTPSKATSAGQPAAPTSFAILAGWRALIKCLFPKSITGDILTLVHLSNAFELVEVDTTANPRAHAPLVPGEVVDSHLTVTEVSNSASGKVVSCEGLISRSGVASDAASASGSSMPWVRIKSQFLFRGTFTDHTNSFKCTPPEGASYSVALPTPAAVAVLTSKPWFKPAATAVVAAAGSSTSSAAEPSSPANADAAASASPLAPGDVLRFAIHSQEVFSDATTLKRVHVTGTVVRTGRAAGSAATTGDEVVGAVDFDYTATGRGGVKGNPVTAYLARASGSASPSDGVAPLETAFTLLATPDVIAAPSDNTPYAIASRDLNPIHRNPVIADLAGLPDTIVHGMWTSANGQRVLQGALDIQMGNTKADGTPNHTFEAQRMIKSYAASFVGMVMPGDTIVTQVSHTGVHTPTGRRVMSITSSAVRKASGASELVLSATAQIDALPTAYVFTGQGSAAPGMGMDLYESSPVAKGVWDTADKHLRATYGFSILDIVRTNPKSLTIHFGGKKGSAIRRNYMALETDDGSGPKPLLPSITEDTDSYTFVHPEGLLFATQFTQPALVLVEKAAFDDMTSHGLVPARALFAGHSLGEYAALSSAVPLLPVPTLVSLTFLRGMTMQGAVPRDATGRTDFAMVACSPNRVGPFFTESVMHQLVSAISKYSSSLLQVVNYNVMDRQYVVAGHLRALDIMGNTLSMARKEPSLVNDPIALVKRAFDMTDKKTAEANATGKKITLERGEATIPLAGIGAYRVVGVDFAAALVGVRRSCCVIVPPRLLMLTSLTIHSCVHHRPPSFHPLSLQTCHFTAPSSSAACQASATCSASSSRWTPSASQASSSACWGATSPTWSRCPSRWSATSLTRS